MLVAGNKKPRTKAGLGLRGRQADLSQPPETTKPVSDGLYRCSNMAEAMGFELMDLLQSTVFKTVALNHSATPPNVVSGAIIPE